MSRDLRKYRRQTTIRLIIGGLILLFVVGTGLIYLIYGQPAAMSGFVCLAIGMVPLVAILMFFWVIDWIIKRSQDE